jgi:hypothetical protein
VPLPPTSPLEPKSPASVLTRSLSDALPGGEDESVLRRLKRHAKVMHPKTNQPVEFIDPLPHQRNGGYQHLLSQSRPRRLIARPSLSVHRASWGQGALSGNVSPCCYNKQVGRRRRIGLGPQLSSPRGGSRAV